jgi:hypothetical protein
MKKIILLVLLGLSLAHLQKAPAWSDEFKKRDAVLAQYKKWLDTYPSRKCAAHSE